jgi:hypothetical protein
MFLKNHWYVARGTTPADEGLLAMRRIIRRLYGEEQKRGAKPTEAHRGPTSKRSAAA